MRPITVNKHTSTYLGIVVNLTDEEAALDDRTLARRIAERTWLSAVRKRAIGWRIERKPRLARLSIIISA